MPSADEILSTLPTGPGGNAGQGGGFNPNVRTPGNRAQQIAATMGGGNFYRDYQNIAAANAQAQQQQQQQDAGRSMVANMFDPHPYDKYKPGSNARKMNPFERGLLTVEEKTADLAQITGWDPNKPLTDVENDVRFITSIPFQMVSGIGEGLTSAYEGMTGTPVRSGDLETGTVSEDKLNAQERATMLANAGIDLGLLAMGGSGRIIGGIGKAATGGKAFNSMADGWISRAVAEAGGSKPVQVAAQTAFDVADESSQEFVQSYLEDMRFNQLGEDSLSKALLGAKWGAFGGGVMSAGGQAISYATGHDPAAQNSADGQTSENPADSGSDHTVQDYSGFLPELRGRNASTRGMTQFNQEAARAITEEKARKYAGSTVAKQVSSRLGARIDDSTLDAGIVHEIFNGSYRGRDVLTKWFDTDAATLAQAVNSATYNGREFRLSDGTLDTAGALNELFNATRGGRHRAAIGRNPDTKNGGYYTDIVGFTNGGGLQTSALAYTTVGSDIDGDDAGIYFDVDRINDIGYVSDLLRHPEGGMNVDLLYAGLGHNVSHQKVKDVFSAVFRGAKKDGESLAQKYIKRFIEIMDQVEDGKSFDDLSIGKEQQAEYSQLLEDMMDDLDAENRRRADAGEQNMLPSSRRALNDVVEGLSMRSKDLISAVVETQANSFHRHLSQEENMEMLLDGLSSPSETLNARGNAAGRVQPVQLYDILGCVSYSLTGKGNIAFRQFGQLAYASKDKMAFSEAMRILNNISQSPTIFSSMIRATFRMPSFGANPSTAIEGLIDTFVIGDTFRQFGVDRKIETSEDLDTFKSLFREAYNNRVEEFNVAKEKLTSDGFVLPADVIERRHIASNDDVAIFEKVLDTFSDVSVDQLFDTKRLPERYQGLSLRNFIEPLAEDGYTKGTAMFPLGDRGIQAFVDRMVSAMTRKQHRTGEQIKNAIVGMDSLVSQVAEHYDPETHTMSNGVQLAWASCVDAFTMFLGFDTAARAGFYGDLLDTRLGRALLYDPEFQGEGRLNALVAVSWDAQFRDLVEGLNSDNKQVVAEATRLLADAAEVSSLHRAIVTQLLNDGHSDLLDYMTDLSIPWSQKESEFALQRDGDGVSAPILKPTEDLVCVSFLDERGSFDLSGTMVKIRKGEQSIASMRRQLDGRDRAAIEEVEHLLNVGGVSDEFLVDWLRDQAAFDFEDYDLSILGAEAYTSATVAIDAVEKGVIELAAALNHQSLELIINGGQMSFISNAIDLANGVITMDNFVSNRKLLLKVLSDPDFSIRVVDPVSGKSVNMNQDALIASVDDTFKPGDRVTNRHILAVLKEYPQLAGWIGHNKIQPGMSDDAASVSNSVSGGFANSFKSYYNAHYGTSADRDLLLDYKLRQAKNTVGVYLLNQTWYKGYLIRCIKDIDNKLTPTKLTNEMRSLHQQAVDAAFYFAQHDPSGNEFRTKYSAFLGDVQGQFDREIDALAEHMKAFLQVQHAEANSLFAYELSSSNVNLLSAFEESKEELVNNGVISSDSAPSPISLSINGDKVANDVKTVLDVTKKLQAIVASTNSLSSDTRFIGALNDADVNSLVMSFFNAWSEAHPNHPSATSQEGQDQIARIREVVEKKVRETPSVNARINDALEDVFGGLNTGALIDPSNGNEQNARQLAVRMQEIADYAGTPHYRATEDVAANRLAVNEGRLSEILYIGPNGPEVRYVDSEILQEANDAIEEAVKKGGQDALLPGSGSNTLLSLRKKWNNYLADSVINEIRSITGGMANAGAYRAETDFVSEMQEFLPKLRKDLAGKGVSFDNAQLAAAGESAVPNFPIPSFTNQTAEAMVNHMRILEEAGFVPSTVGINGAMAKRMFGYAFLPRSVMGSVAPRQMTGAEALKLMKTFPNARCTLDPGSVTTVEDLTTLSAIEGQLNGDPNAVVFVYHPEDNPVGIDDSHTPAPVARTNGKYKRFPGILAYIIDWSQEANVLKAKKTLGQRELVVDDYTDKFGRKRQRVDSAELNNPATARQAMRDFLVKQRNDFAKELANEFHEKKALEDGGLGFEEALILAQAFSPALDLTVRTTEGIRHVTMSAVHLFESDASAFDARIAAIHAEGGEIVAASVLNVAAEEPSFKIMRAVAALESAVEKPSLDDYTRAAYDAMTNWDEFEEDSLSVSEVMSMVPALGNAHYSRITMPDSRTPVQFIMDQEFGNIGAGKRVNLDGRLVNIEWYKEDDRRMIAAKALTNELFPPTAEKRQAKFTVIQAYVPTPNSLTKPNMKRLFDELSVLEKEEDRKTRSGAAVVLDRTRIGDALRWGAERDQGVIIPNSIVDSVLNISQFPELFGSTAVKIKMNLGGEMVDATVFEPAQSLAYRQFLQSVPTGDVTTLTPDMIFGCLITDIYNTGDAGIFASDRMVDFFTRHTSHKEFALRDMFRSGPGARYSVITREQAEELKAKIASGTWPEEEFDFKNVEGGQFAGDYLQSLITRYLDAVIAKDPGTDSVLHTGVGTGDVVALVTDGDHFAPVILPNSAPNVVEYLGLAVDGGTLSVGWVGQHSLDTLREEYSKLGLDGETFKGIMTLFSRQTKKKGWPTAMPTTAQGQMLIDLVAAADTEGSRVKGKEKSIFAKDMWYFNRKNGYNALFDIVDSNGNPSHSGTGVKWRGAMARWTDQQRADFYNSERSALKSVANGLWAMSDDAEENAVLQKVVNLMSLYKMPVRHVFSTWEVGTTTDATGARVSSEVQLNRDIRSFYLLFNNLSYEEIMTFWHFVDPNLCFKNYAEAATSDRKPLFDIHGNMLVDIPGVPNASGVYVPCRWGPHRVIGDESTFRGYNNDAGYAWQHVARRGQDNGIMGSEIQDAVRYAEYMTGDVRAAVKSRIKERLKEAAEDAGRPSVRQLEYDRTTMADIKARFPNDSFLQVKYRKSVLDVGRNRTKPIKVVDNGEVLQEPDKNAKIAAAFNEFRSFFGNHWTYEMAMLLVARQQGHTNLDGGVNEISVDNVAKAMRDIVRHMKDPDLKVPVANNVKNNKVDGNRFALPRLSRDEIDWLWKSENVQRSWNHDRQAFEEAIKAESDAACAQIKSVPNTRKQQRDALMHAMEYDYNQWGEHAQLGYIYANTYVEDLVQASTQLGNALRQGQSKGAAIDIDLWNRLTSTEQEKISDFARIAENSNNVISYDITGAPGDIGVQVKTSDGKTMNAMLNNMTELTKVMALINPGVLVSNVLDRGVHQGIMKASMALGRKLHLGPYVARQHVNQSVVRAAARNPILVKLYIAYRQAAFTGQEIEFLGSIQSAADIESWLENRQKAMTPYQRACDRIYDLSSGGNKMLYTQIENFINRFAMFAEVTEGQDFWFQKTVGPEGEEISLLESKLMGDGAGKWFLEVMGAHGGRTPSFTIALQAMNSAKQGDMAQRNVISAIIGDVCRRSPVSKFLITTGVSRFPAYSTNVAGRMLNWVMPMSSINYMFTEHAAEIARAYAERHNGVDPHYETVQIHTSLREAMLVDITHLGVGATALVLVGIGMGGLGGLEPPDDEKKWGNTDEWTVMGMRVGESWWIEDILGMALPLACYTKSMQLGKPRLDILTNGTAQALYNNPIIKVADAVGFLMEPENSFVSDYNEDYANFQNARGGAPSWTDWLQANATSFGLSWASQFITPSVVREWYVAGQDFEASYKKVYEESETGTLTAEGLEGATMNTTYQDAMLRRTTRRNPVLGWLCDQVLHPNTGYMWHEMPNTVYYDDAQLASMEKWSISGLSDEEAQAKCLEIITLLCQYDDMNELRATGFYLDYETKAAVSSVVWDTVDDLNQWYTNLQKSGALDYYTLGDGDFKLGQQRAAEIKEAYYAQKNMWSDFYYDKICSDALSEPLVTYNRYNTTYARDSEGNAYATGFRPQGVLPFVSAPGMLDNPEGTAGWANDWVTVSAVTGQPMEGQRALVPTDQGYESWPALEWWSEDGQGNGKSDLYKSWYGSYYNSTWGDGSDSGSTSTSGKSGTRYRRYYPRSGYRRSSGGYGGGGYSSSPNIYSRPSSGTMSTPRTMDRVALQWSEFDYLRPAFQTKGSREAYRRDDF